MRMRCSDDGPDDQSDLESSTYTLTAADNGCSGTQSGTDAGYPVPAPDGSDEDYYSVSCTLSDTVGQRCTVSVLDQVRNSSLCCGAAFQSYFYCREIYRFSRFRFILLISLIPPLAGLGRLLGYLDGRGADLESDSQARGRGSWRPDAGTDCTYGFPLVGADYHRQQRAPINAGD